MQKFIATKKFIRVISGGVQTDFEIDEEEKAYEFFRKEARVYTYASIHYLYEIKKTEKELFKSSEEKSWKKNLKD